LARQFAVMAAALTCPTSLCSQRPRSGALIRHGTFRRKEDGRRIQRYFCRYCGRSPSSSTWSPAYRQKKRRINEELRRLLTIKVSQRAIARHLGINPKTVDRKLVYWGRVARRYFATLKVRDLAHVQFDELQSSVHTKCKPISMPVAVCAETRMILALGVASMPAQHPLKEIALRKYGPRADDRPAEIERVLRRIRPMMRDGAMITTDMAPRYPGAIRSFLPGARHIAHRSRKARKSGNGELKKIGFDPLFPLNHTAAMLRDSVSRMVRQTWCNSKRQDRHEDHLYIAAQMHNHTRLRKLPQGA
jgi:transposase-like protein